MKYKTNTDAAPRQNHHTPRRLFCRPVSYRWSTPDGAIHHASTVVTAGRRRDLDRAEQNFWTTNTHVIPSHA